MPHFLRLSCGYHDNISNAKSSETKIAPPQLQWGKKNCVILPSFSQVKISSLFLLTEQQIIVWAQARLDFLTLWVLISCNLTMTGAFSTVQVTHLFQCRKFDTLHKKLTDILVSKPQKCVFIASLFHLHSFFSAWIFKLSAQVLFMFTVVFLVYLSDINETVYSFDRKFLSILAPTALLRTHFKVIGNTSSYGNIFLVFSRDPS